MKHMFFLGSFTCIVGLLYWIARAWEPPKGRNALPRALSSDTVRLLDLLEEEVRPRIEANQRQNLPYRDMVSLYLNSRSYVESAHGANLYDPSGEQALWVMEIERRHARLRGELFLALLEALSSLLFGTRSPLHAQAVLSCYADEIWIMGEMNNRRCELLHAGNKG